MNMLRNFYYRLVSVKIDRSELEKYREKFSYEQLNENAKVIPILMIILEIVELFFVLCPFVLASIKKISMIFIITNGLLILVDVYLKQKPRQKRFKLNVFFQHSVFINFIALSIALNVVTMNSLDFIHVYIVTLMFISIALYIPVISLTLLTIISAFIQILFILNLQLDAMAQFHQVSNIIVFVSIAWYLGIISNQKKIELWINHQNQVEINQRLEDSNKRDSMTRFYNHESILIKLERLIKQASADQSVFSVLMIDIDDFKHINDHFGHLEGDRVLLEVAKSIRKCVRDIDFIGRYGGEEFLILFPQTDLKAARIVCERIRTVIESLVFDHTRLTISGGLVEFQQQSADELLSQVDLCLYLAKRSGKNKIIDTLD